MSALLESPPRVVQTRKMKRSSPARPIAWAKLPVYRFTRAELYRMCDDGWFADKRVNLIDGRIIAMPLPSPEHYWALRKLAFFLTPLIPAGHHDRQENALAVSPHDDPGPDYAIVPGTLDDYLSEYPSQALFTAEIANRTLKTDLRVKSALYASAGVPEYWVVDLTGRRIVVHTQPRTDDGIYSYGSVVTFVEGQTVAPHFAPAASIAVASLLPPISPEAS